MVRRRGVARTSAPRRRVFRVKIKWDPRIAARRMKLLLPLMAEELSWEIEVLLLLEQDVYPYLESQGIPPDLQEHYVAFAKRMWERRVHFNKETFALEKQSLLNEFEWRGLNLTHLDAIQVFAEAKALQKLRVGRVVTEYPGVTVLADTDDMASLPGVTVTEGVPVGPARLPGVTVIADTNSMIQMAGVTVVKGTV